MRLRIISAVALAVALAAPSQAAAAKTKVKKRCYTVNAHGAGKNVDNRTDMTFSKDKLLKGPATGGFAIVGGEVPKFDITTDLTFNTRYGKFTVDSTGWMDISDGTFESSGPIRAGTKHFKGAKGTLKFVGKADIASGDFTDKVTGRICARKAFALR